MINEFLLLTHPSPILGIRDKGVNKRRPLLGERQMVKKTLNKIGNLKKKRARSTYSQGAYWTNKIKLKKGSLRIQILDWGLKN